jgi:hypothetical protein
MRTPAGDASLKLQEPVVTVAAFEKEVRKLEEGLNKNIAVTNSNVRGLDEVRRKQKLGFTKFNKKLSSINNTVLLLAVLGQAGSTSSTSTGNNDLLTVLPLLLMNNQEEKNCDGMDSMWPLLLIGLGR